MRTGLIIFLAFFLVGCANLNKVSSVGDNISNRREAIEWCDIRHFHANDTSLPRVLLIGDSITRAYGDIVASGLDGKVFVSKFTTSRFPLDPVYTGELDLVLSEYKYDVIHFNNGLHGRDFSTSEYRKGLEAVFAKLKATGAKVIWASSTQINPGAGEFYDQYCGVIPERNKVGAELAEKYGCQIDDLYTLTLGKKDLYIDNFHYNREGVRLQAAKVTAAIESELR